jgi:tryptophan halogenase
MTKIKNINHVVIVGGGSSAWLTAAHLTKNTDLKITVIDKAISTPIGVGEATVLNFKWFMAECGFGVDDWFPHINSTFKTGIYFTDWIDKGSEIWHPFVFPNVTDDVSLQSLWAKNQEYDFKTFGASFFEESVINNQITNAGRTAFHINAAKLAEFLQIKLQDKVQLIKSQVVSINRQKKIIKSLVLENGEVIDADFFVDCTGFLSLLNPDRKTVSLKDRIFTDTAVAGMVNYADKRTELKPYTTAAAVDHGWIWKIPIQTRIGSGLVFNRSITPIETAKEYFIDHWGKDRVNLDSIRVIDWTPYYNPTPWDHNVISVGLSAGFIEPLESTGLALTMMQASMLTSTIRDRMWSYHDQDEYNLWYTRSLNECVDFVSMHYSKTNRTEPFWQFVKETFKPSDRMSAIIKMASERLLLDTYRKTTSTFGGLNWNAWLAQMKYPIGQGTDTLSKQEAELLMLSVQGNKNKYPDAIDHLTEIERLQKYYNIQ